MIENTEAYKGRRFTCGNCGYVVSSDATDDFDVEDFQFCPYCGNSVQEVAKEYESNIILDFLQYVRDNADREEFNNEDGWALSDLIILATEYQKGE